jgi:uncharacterized membrane protein YjjP (DUF1212 family)
MEQIEKNYNFNANDNVIKIIAFLVVGGLASLVIYFDHESTLPILICSNILNFVIGVSVTTKK